jgi:hypothetical protein
MGSRDKVPDFRDASLGARCDSVLLGRLGRELASVFGDTLQAPLPSRLHALMERLETVLELDTAARQHPAPGDGRSSP